MIKIIYLAIFLFLDFFIAKRINLLSNFSLKNIFYVILLHLLIVVLFVCYIKIDKTYQPFSYDIFFIMLLLVLLQIYFRFIVLFIRLFGISLMKDSNKLDYLYIKVFLFFAIILHIFFAFIDIR